MMKRITVLALFLALVVNSRAQSTHSVKLTWSPSTTIGVTYFIYRGTKAGGEDLTAPLNSTGVATGCVTAATCTFTDSNVQPGTTYFYVVESSLNQVNSLPSNETSAIVPVKPVGNLTIIQSH